MSSTETIDRFVAQEYKWGFYTDVEADYLMEAGVHKPDQIPLDVFDRYALH